jgi:hypothetical protein
MSYPNGVTTSYSYDDLNRLLRLKADKGQTAITDFQYGYDNAGNRLSKQQQDYTETYGYDPLYRLTDVMRGTDVTHYTYDPVGNRLGEQVGTSVVSGTFNEKNQLLARSAGGSMRWRGSLNEPGGVSFTSATVNGKPARMLAGNVFEADITTTSGSNTVTVQATDTSGNVTTKDYSVSVVHVRPKWQSHLKGRGRSLLDVRVGCREQAQACVEERRRSRCLQLRPSRKAG